MTRTTTRPKPISEAQTAEWLFEHGVGLLAVETDEGLTRWIAEVLVREKQRLGAAPSDYDAVRTELRRLWGLSEAVERSRLCARYTPDFMRVR